MEVLFKTGQFYTRAYIHSVVGGSVQSGMPVANGVVVALCLLPDEQPDAPRVVLIGSARGTEAAADVLVAQATPVPVFMKRAANQWECAGRFVVDRASDAWEDIERYTLIAGRHDLTRVLWMKPAAD